MSQYDCPDYEHIVTIAPPGSEVDCPDWQEQVTGPGGGIVTGFAGDGWVPQVMGIGAWTFPPFIPTVASNAFTNGEIYLTFLPVGANCTVSQIYIRVTTSLATPTTNENYIGVYQRNTVSGVGYTLIGATAAGTGDAYFGAAPNDYYVPFASSFSLVAGKIYYLAILANGASNSLKLLASSLDSNGVANSGGLFGTEFVVDNTHIGAIVIGQPWIPGGQTSLPSSWNPTAGLTNGQAVWAQLLP